MIFTQADKMNLQAVKTLLVQHVQETGGDDEIVRLLNELGVALGRIESRLKDVGIVVAGVQQAIPANLLGEVSSLGMWFKQFDRAVTDTVNRRANEVLDVVRGELAKHTEGHAAAYDRLQSEMTSRIAALDRRLTQFLEPLGQLTGLVQAEVSEASQFRKDVMQALSCLTDAQRLAGARLNDIEQKVGARDRELFECWFKQGAASERLNANKRKARRKKK